MGVMLSCCRRFCLYFKLKSPTSGIAAHSSSVTSASFSFNSRNCAPICSVCDALLVSSASSSLVFLRRLLFIRSSIAAQILSASSSSSSYCPSAAAGASMYPPKASYTPVPPAASSPSRLNRVAPRPAPAT